MPLSKNIFVRTLIAAVIIGILAVFSYLVKETIDSVMPPQNSLPIISGSIGYSQPDIVMGGYEWNYLTRVVRQPTVSPPDLRMITTEVAPGTPIVINFSKQPETLLIKRSDGQYSQSYTEQEQPVITPTEPNIYTYSVEASFDRGSIIYYFTVEVKAVV